MGQYHNTFSTTLLFGLILAIYAIAYLGLNLLLIALGLSHDQIIEITNKFDIVTMHGIRRVFSATMFIDGIQIAFCAIKELIEKVKAGI